MNTPTSITLSPEHQAFLDATFARNRAQYGGFFMETPDEGGEGGAGAGTESEPGDEAGKEGKQPGDETPPGEGDPKEGEDEDSGLDLTATKAALATVRRSEAKTRERLRNVEAQLVEAKTPEQVEELLKKVREDNKTDADSARALLVENVALKHKLPEDLAELLKGDTREELEAHAVRLAKFAPAEPSDDPDLSGGLDPSGKPTLNDKDALLKIMRGGR